MWYEFCQSCSFLLCSSQCLSLRVTILLQVRILLAGPDYLICVLNWTARERFLRSDLDLYFWMLHLLYTALYALVLFDSRRHDCMNSTLLQPAALLRPSIFQILADTDINWR